MKYKYSICYPDKEEIEHIEKSVDRDEVVSLVKNHNWAEEIQKEIEHYSPNLDFISLKNRKRIIMSGFGNTALEGFYITYITPNDIGEDLLVDDSNAHDVFNQDYYLGGEDYSSEFGTEESFEILDAFLSENYDDLVSIFVSEEEEEPWQRELYEREMEMLINSRKEDQEINEALMKKENSSEKSPKKWWEFWK